MDDSVRLRSDVKGSTFLMNHQVRCVTNDDACNTHNDCDARHSVRTVTLINTLPRGDPSF